MMTGKRTLLVLLLVVCLLLGGCGTGGSGKQTEDVHLSDGKPWIDTDLKENIVPDMETDPREDLHLFAGKDWMVKIVRENVYDEWTHYDERDDEVCRQCQEILKDESLDGHDAELTHTMRHLLLDWDTRDQTGLKEISPVAASILQADSLTKVTSLLLQGNNIDLLYHFVDLDVDPGIRDSSRYVVYVRRGDLLLDDPAEYQDRSEYGKMEYAYRRDVFLYLAERLGMDGKEAQERFRSAIALEKKLAASAMTFDEELDESYYSRINNEADYGELQSMAGSFPLAKLVEKAGYMYDGTYIVEEPAYLKQLGILYTENNLESIRNLIYVNYLLSQKKYLDRKAYEYENDTYNRCMGGEGIRTDEEMAFDEVADLLPVPLQKLYVTKHGSPKEKKKLEQLCRKVIGTYRKLLEENTWASRETIQSAVRKLDAMEIHAAYPEKWVDYRALSLKDCSLYEAQGAIARFEREYDSSLAGTERDPENWGYGMDLLECNAFFMQSENSINLPIGMMGEPFYSEDMSVEELYASMGAFWIGHEISHAFDSVGAQFGPDGDKENWWTRADSREFRKRMDKLDAYLDTIVAFDDLHVKGANVDTEMTADITGLQCALRMAAEEKAFDYRAFFLKYAQLNAVLNLYSTELNMLTQDEHPPDYLRTNVSVQQFDEFYRTFGVKKGDRMYLAPEKRMIIW